MPLRTQLDPEAPHSIIHTSGTTARPKPVVLTYGEPRTRARRPTPRTWASRDDDAWLGVLPLFHVGGLQVLIRSAIYGTTAVLHDGFDADRVRASLESGEVTLASFVATMVRRLREAGWEQRAAAARRADRRRPGAARPARLGRGASGLPLMATYGMTETASQVVTGNPPRRVARRRAAHLTRGRAARPRAHGVEGRAERRRMAPHGRPRPRRRRRRRPRRGPHRRHDRHRRRERRRRRGRGGAAVAPGRPRRGRRRAAG